ncbi:HD domain-containing protein [Chitinophaga sancti]|uniref:HD domain-containing protein n=1 Tax=Chitinophaga sancti TaxID=1004 RepID=UPI002A74AAC2|nr:HD domain-containing protein [Chitinophaga sancti]WPQ62508.1 HD domain-containing protein [Chitinophaga sancti]
MTQDQLIDNTVAYVKQELAHAEGGHDWWHIHRVWHTAGEIAAKEPVNPLIVSLGALLHDIADAKFHGGDETIGPAKARQFLESQGVEEDVITHVIAIVENISFKGGHNEGKFTSPELAVVQDADRLDAIGAIGIARAFNYGGFKNRQLYDPAIPPDLQMSREQYKNSTAPTINHFYEKLLLLKDKMNTTTGRALAAERHAFMETFLEQFYKEWH